MKKYRIGVSELQTGYVYIQAKNEKEAEQIALYRLNDEGIESFDDFDVKHREVDIV